MYIEYLFTAWQDDDSYFQFILLEGAEPSSRTILKAELSVSSVSQCAN
jgi:hypothetical protein